MHRWIIAATIALVSCGSTTQKAEMPPAETDIETTENSTDPTPVAENTGDGESWREFRRVVNDETGEVVWEGPDKSKIEVQKEEISDEAAHKAFLKAFYARLAEQEYEFKQE